MFAIEPFAKSSRERLCLFFLRPFLQCCPKEREVGLPTDPVLADFVAYRTDLVSVLGFDASAMAKVPINDPKHWRERAEEARTVADEMTDPDSKRKMLRIADDYEELARRAELRLKAASKHCTIAARSRIA
jgi:hypothetical protein